MGSCVLWFVEQTERVIQAASEIKRTGATGAYTQEFELMERKLNDVRQYLQNTTKSSLDLTQIDKLVDDLRYKLLLFEIKVHLLEILTNNFF